MKSITPYLWLLLAFGCLLWLCPYADGQTFTVGSTTQQLNPSQRNSVAGTWPDGNMGVMSHSGTNYVFAPSTFPGTVAISLSNLNNWSSGLSIVNGSSGNISYGGTGAFDQNYVGGGAVYDDTAVSGYYFHVYHGENWNGCPSNCSVSYAALGLAYSNNLSGPWTKLGEIVSPQTARVVGGTECQVDVGVGTLLVVGSYFYAYYDDQATGCSGNLSLAVARAPISSVRAAVVAGTPFTSGPGTLFMKYTGSGAWTGDGVTDLANPQNGGGAFAVLTTDFNGHGTYTPQVRYNSYLNQYVLTYSNFFDIVLMTSSDGLTWGNAQNIVTGGGIPPNGIFYPALINTSGGDPQVLGQNFSVFYVYPFGNWSNSSVYSVAITASGGSTPFNLGVTATNGSVNTSNNCAPGSYASGTAIGPCTATANAGYVFTGWSGPCSGTSACSFTLTANTTLTVNFTTGGGGNACAPGQPTYVAASANYSDVNAIVNGPTHTVQNNDCIVIPAGSSTWTSEISHTGIGFTLTGTGTLNTTASTYGSGTLQTIITDALPNTATPMISVTGLTTSSSTMRISGLDIEPTTGNNLYSPLNISGTCTVTTCPNARIDNIGIGLTTPWNINSTGTNGNPIRTDNVFGVIDHNTMGTGFYGVMAEINHSAYLGVGGNGDNSWAQPDSTGSLQAMFVENNQVYNQQNLTETEFGAFGGGIGGSRQVCRFNQVTGYSQFSLCSGHGLESDGRPQGIRQIEAYNNSVFCANGSCTTGGPSYRSGGTGYTFNNAYTVAAGQDIGWMFDMNAYRTIFNASYWGACGGSSPFDTNDTNGGGGNTAFVYYTETVASASNVSGTNPSWNLTMTISSSPWTTNQFVPSGAPYSVYDVTKNWWGEIQSNTANSITVIDSIGTTGTGAYGFTVGDTIKVQRAFVCGDQPGRGQGNYVSGTPPLPASALSQALSPIYEWNDSASSGVIGVWREVSTSRLLPNRDFYVESMNQAAQTSATSPFDGTGGTGHGTLANRPTTCTTGVGYWAADQGSWNLSGLACTGNGTGVGQGCQGELFKCTSTNTWTLAMTPAQYPHPLIGGGLSQVATPSFSPSSGAPPQTVTTTTSTSGATLCGRNDGGTPTATTAGTCDSSPTFTITGTQSVTINPTTLTAIGTKTGYTNSFVASATYNSSVSAATPVWTPVSGGYVYGYPVTLATSTTGCGSYIWWGSVNPPTAANAYNTQSLNNYSAGTYYAKVIGCPGFADSGVATVTYTIVSGPPPPTSVNATLNGAIQ